jgi:hypothetical protein
MKGLFYTLLGAVVMFVLINPPITFPYPDTRMTITWGEIAADSVQDVSKHDSFAITMATNPVLDSLMRTQYASDTDQARKNLYDALINQFDSVHAWSIDPRIDSLWKYLRPRLVYVGKDFALHEQEFRHDACISLIPVFLMKKNEFAEFEKTKSPFSECSPSEVLGYYNHVALVQTNTTQTQVRNLVVPWKSISLYSADEINIRGLTSVLYHEGAHAFYFNGLVSCASNQFDSLVYLLDQTESAQHPTIANISASVLQTYLAHDSVLAGLAKKCSFSYYHSPSDGTVIYATDATEFADAYMSSDIGNGNATDDLAFLKLYYEKQGGWNMSYEQNRAAYNECQKKSVVSVAATIVEF